MTKVLIEIRGGNVVNIAATDKAEFVIVDHDNLERGDNNLRISYRDQSFHPGKAHELFTDSSDPAEMEIKDELKRIKF